MSAKGLAIDLINKYSILNGEKLFSSRIYQNYQNYLYQLKIILNILMALLGLIREKSNGLSEKTAFANHHVLPGTSFNRYCLINSIYIPRKVINIYFLNTNSMVKKVEDRFYIKQLLICIC